MFVCQGVMGNDGVFWVKIAFSFISQIKSLQAFSHLKCHTFLFIPVKYLLIGMRLWLNGLALCQHVKEDVGETDVRCKCDRTQFHSPPQPAHSQLRPEAERPSWYHPTNNLTQA